MYMDLNDILKDCKEIICFYGEASSGKSLFCFLAMLEKLKEKKKVIFLDIGNSFSLDRFKQLAGEDYENLLDNLLFFKVKNFKDQQLKIKGLKELVKKSKASLVILDSLVFFYRRMVKTRSELSNGMLKSQINYLKDIVKEVPVLVTSEVYLGLKSKQLEPIGGSIIKNNCKLIKLEKKPRKLILDDKEIFFNIVEKGIVEV